MPRLPLLLLALVIVLHPGSAAAQAAPHCRPGQLPSFVLFDELKSWLGAVMGDAAECEHLDLSTGDTVQATATGLAVWRAESASATFRAGGQNWALVDGTLLTWVGDSLDPPENAEAAERLPGRAETPPEPWEVRIHVPATNLAGTPDPGRWVAHGYDIAAPSTMWPALELLQARGFGGVLSSLHEARARVAWGALPTTAWGSFSPARNEVVVSQTLESYPADNVAVVLVHEATHLSDYVSRRLGTSAADCLAAERRAYEAEAAFWRALYGPRGKANATTPLERSENSLVYVLSADQRSFDAQLATLYDQQCARPTR